MKLSIHAWRASHYVSLAELLLLVEQFVPEKQWFVQIQEIAPEPGAELFESCDPRHPLVMEDLLRLSAPNIQIIDGEIIAVDGDGNSCLLLRSVDSTSWDIETDNMEIIAKIKERFSDAIEIED